MLAACHRWWLATFSIKKQSIHICISKGLPETLNRHSEIFYYWFISSPRTKGSWRWVNSLIHYNFWNNIPSQPHDWLTHAMGARFLPHTKRSILSIDTCKMCKLKTKLIRKMTKWIHLCVCGLTQVEKCPLSAEINKGRSGRQGDRHRFITSSCGLWWAREKARDGETQRLSPVSYEHRIIFGS